LHGWRVGLRQIHSALSVMNLLPRGSTRTADHIRFHGQICWACRSARLHGCARQDCDDLPGTDDEPEPCYSIGSQMSEVLERHRRATRRQAMDRAARIAGARGITAPGMRLASIPINFPGACDSG